MNLFIFNMIGGWQLIIIVIAILLIFGGRKIPELMKGLGQGMKEFKNAVKEENDEKEINSEKETKSKDSDNPE